MRDEKELREIKILITGDDWIVRLKPNGSAAIIHQDTAQHLTVGELEELVKHRGGKKNGKRED